MGGSFPFSDQFNSDQQKIREKKGWDHRQILLALFRLLCHEVQTVLILFDSEFNAEGLGNRICNHKKTEGWVMANRLCSR